LAGRQNTSKNRFCHFQMVAVCGGGVIETQRRKIIQLFDAFPYRHKKDGWFQIFFAKMLAG